MSSRLRLAHLGAMSLIAEWIVAGNLRCCFEGLVVGRSRRAPQEASKEFQNCDQAGEEASDPE